MIHITCERCGQALTAVPGCLYLCKRCGIGYSFQWELSDQNRLGTVMWRHTVPSEEEQARQLQWLLEQKRAALAQLAQKKGLLAFRRRRAIQLALGLIQRQIDLCGTR